MRFQPAPAVVAAIIAPVLVLLLMSSSRATSPTDIVPDGSGLYDAIGILAEHHVLGPNAPDATDLFGVTHKLYTRSEMAAWISNIVIEPSDPRLVAALAFARNILAPELHLKSGAGTKGATLGGSGVAVAEEAGKTDKGSGLASHGYVVGRGRVYGSLGRDGAYTVSVTDLNTLTRDHSSYSTTGGPDNPGVLNGIDEAYATVLGSHGLRVTAGLLRQDWGPGYIGDTMVDANAPAHPTIQLELPFRISRTFGDYRFTQYESTFDSEGTHIDQGARRLEHPIGDRVSLDIEERYQQTNFSQPIVLILPYYTYQQHDIHGNEPAVFNYYSDLGLTVRPAGPNVDARLYGELGIDDIKAPFHLGKGNNTPQKIAYLVGYAQTFPKSGTDAVFELSTVDRATYTDTVNPRLAWYTGGLPEGLPVGSNGKDVYIRLGQKIAQKWTAAIDFSKRGRLDNDLPAPTWEYYDLDIAYRLHEAESVGLVYTSYNETPFSGVITADNPGTAGGADYGQRIHRRILGLSFTQGF